MEPVVLEPFMSRSPGVDAALRYSWPFGIGIFLAHEDVLAFQRSRRRALDRAQRAVARVQYRQWGQFRVLRQHVLRLRSRQMRSPRHEHAAGPPQILGVVVVVARDDDRSDWRAGVDHGSNGVDGRRRRRRLGRLVGRPPRVDQSLHQFRLRTYYILSTCVQRLLELHDIQNLGFHGCGINIKRLGLARPHLSQKMVAREDVEVRGLFGERRLEEVRYYLSYGGVALHVFCDATRFLERSHLPLYG